MAFCAKPMRIINQAATQSATAALAKVLMAWPLKVFAVSRKDAHQQGH